MINNNPYNIPQKKPLSQSKILSQTNSSRHSSTYSQNRNSNQVMYSSGIFMKNSTMVNLQYDQTFYQPAKQPLSPHTKFVKSPPIQFIPTQNIIRPQENFFIAPTIPKQINTPKEFNLEKTLSQLKEKIQNLEKKIQNQQRKQNNSKQIQFSKFHINPQSQVLKAQFLQNFRKNDELKETIKEIIKLSLENQNRQNWKIMQTQFQNEFYKNDKKIFQKLNILEDFMLKSQTVGNFQEQSHVRIKSIQKTIRQMGEDIHLINNKVENFSQKFISENIELKNEIKQFKCLQKIINQQKKSNQKINKVIQKFENKFLSVQDFLESNLSKKIRSIQQNFGKLLNQCKDVKPAFDLKCSQQPIVLKYLQKFQVFDFYYPQQKVEEITISQVTYYIDNQGYLLDNDRFYLIYERTKQKVRLNQKHIQVLKKNRILI